MEKLNREAGATDAPMKTSEVLDKAADVIERNGWFQGGFIDLSAEKPKGEEPCCVLGALSIAEHGDPMKSGSGRVEAVLIDRLDLDVDEADEDYPLGYWNDEPGRTAEEVVRELRAAAASEREAGR